MYPNVMYFQGWWKWNIKLQNNIMSLAYISQLLDDFDFLSWNSACKKYDKNEKVYCHFSDNENIVTFTNFAPQCS